MTTAPKLTTEDLHATLADRRHNGWGYAEVASHVSGRKLESLDKAIVAVANEMGLSYEGLFVWSDSKYGRWLSDEVHGCGAAPTRATVRKLLNPKAMEKLREGQAPEAPWTVGDAARLDAKLALGARLANLPANLRAEVTNHGDDGTGPRVSVSLELLEQYLEGRRALPGAER